MKISLYKSAIMTGKRKFHRCNLHTDVKGFFFFFFTGIAIWIVGRRISMRIPFWCNFTISILDWIYSIYTSLSTLREQSVTYLQVSISTVFVMCVGPLFPFFRVIFSIVLVITTIMWSRSTYNKNVICYNVFEKKKS